MLARIFLALILMSQPALATARNAVHHEVRVHLFPARGRIKIDDIISFTGHGQITLFLDKQFAIKHLSVDGVARSPTRNGDILVVALGHAGVHHISLHENAQFPTRNGNGNGTPVLSADGGVIDGNWLAQPITMTGASRASYRISVTTPPGQISVIDGRLERESHNSNASTSVTFTTTSSRAPILFSGPYRVAEKIAVGVRIRTYFYKELTAISPAYLNNAAKYIAYYSKKIAPYPYTGFAIVSGNAPVGWGLPGMTYMSRRVLTLPFILTTSLPHEILHNWWGNAVGVDAHTGNWAEGLTTYQADYGLAQNGKRGKRAKRLAWLRNYAALPRTRDFALNTFISKTNDASQVIGYGKAAFIFHMLKARVGASVFKRALRLFFTDNLHRRASWRDLQSAFETVSGKTLDAFFKTWITQPGAPRLELKNPHAKGRTVTFTLKQTQNGKAYPLRIPVVLDTIAGERHTIIAMNKKTQTFRISTAAQPLRLRIDPDFDVFRHLNSANTPPILRNVTLNAATVLFIASQNKTTQTLARELAQRLMQNKVREVSVLPPSGPLIIVGLQRDVRARLKDMGLMSLPKPLREPAQAKAFILKIGVHTVLAIIAQDQAGLEVLARALTHYKERSFVIVNAGHVTATRTWPIKHETLTAKFD